MSGAGETIEPRRLDPVDLRHVQVEQNQVEILAQHGLERRLAVADRRDPIAAA